MDTDLDGMIKDEKDVHLEGETMTNNNISLFSSDDSSFDGDPFSPSLQNNKSIWIIF